MASAPKRRSSSSTSGASTLSARCATAMTSGPMQSPGRQTTRGAIVRAYSDHDAEVLEQRVRVRLDLDRAQAVGDRLGCLQAVAGDEEHDRVPLAERAA